MQTRELKSLNRKVAKPPRLRKVSLQNIPPLAYSLRLRAFAVQLLDHLDFLNLSDLPDEIRSCEALFFWDCTEMGRTSRAKPA